LHGTWSLLPLRIEEAGFVLTLYVLDIPQSGLPDSLVMVK